MDKVKSLSVNPKKYDLIILEEFNIALRDKFINKREFLALLKQLSRKSNIVVTGRGATWSLLDVADIAAEMKEIKRYYKENMQAQRGIEY
ncbi:MAG: cob(I)yrinic acid a,c-diamide adenosyltransferase [Endomicrobium sp.]|jgi:cob(I)alamin adenosyltransferase|nr:cob(I)yrinic acid a,c-diamide adenosyltransferase [Endomicrobium sp.]